MKKNLAVVVAVFALCLAFSLVSLAGCSSAKEVAIGSDGKVSFDGANMSIQLPANATTGYEWTCQVQGKYLQCTDSSYIEGSASAGTTGAGGTQVFTFAVQGSPSTSVDEVVELTYARSWEQTPDDLHYTVTVQVSKDGKVVSATPSTNNAKID